MNEQIKRDFKGIWIPKELYLNTELSWTEKILLIEIDSLDSKQGCYASNKYLAKFVHIKEGQCANIISELRKKGYIEDLGFDGRKRYIRVQENLKAEFRKTLTQSSGKSEHINTINNKAYNKTLCSSDFEELWKLFPNKIGKRKTYEAFKKVRLTSEDLDKLKTYLIEYPKAYDRAQIYGFFMPQLQDPERIIKNRRFEDSIPRPTYENGKDVMWVDSVDAYKHAKEKGWDKKNNCNILIRELESV